MSARRDLWSAIEPIHAVAYFHPEATDALTRLGTTGFWMSYFAGRFAPLGAVGPEPVTAMAFGFAPAAVRRALPAAWDLVAPADVVAARVEACGRILSEVTDDVLPLVGALERAVGSCRFDGRPLAAAWSAVDPGDDPFARLWVATSVLREHRGDGYVLAAVAEGLSGLDAGLTHVAAAGTTREVLQRSRWWTDDEWDAAASGLQDRGILDEQGGLTAAGAELRARIERRTDDLAVDAPPGTVELARPLAERILASGLLPVPNPIGVG